MATAYTILNLTGGAATRNLVDGVNYSLERSGWAPSVPGRRRSRLAGSGPYDDGSEQINVMVLGTDGPTAHANLLALADDMDQAARWRTGEEIGPILLNIQPQGSNLAAPLSVPIWGGDVPLGLPATYNDQLMLYEIGPVAIRFRRPGQFVGPTETPAATAAATHPSIFSVIFPSSQAKRLLPLRLEFSGFLGSRDAGGTDLGSAAYLAVASEAAKMKLFEAESASATAPGIGTFNTAVDAAASGGSIRRLVPAAAGDYRLDAVPASAFAVEGVALYTALVVARNNSTTISYTAQFSIYVYGAEAATIKTSPPVVIDTTSQQPGVIRFDPVAFDGLPNRVRLTFAPSAIGTSADQLDVDVFLILQMADPTDRIVSLLNINKAWSSLSLSFPLTLDPRVLTNPLPGVTQATGLITEYRVSYRGDVYLLTTGDRVAACLIGTTGSHWRIVNGALGSSPTAVSSALTATRYLAYRVPQ